MKIVVVEGNAVGGLPKRDLWEGSRRASWGRQVSDWWQRSAAFLTTACSDEMVPPLLHNIHWLFLSSLVLCSEQDLTTSAALAFCGSFLGKSTSRANGYYGLSSRAFFFGPLPSRVNTRLPTAACTAPWLLPGSPWWPEDEWAGRAIKERMGTGTARAPFLRALKGFQWISGIERKFFVIISLLFLVGSVNFSRRQWPELYGNQMTCYLRKMKHNWFRTSIHLLSVV